MISGNAINDILEHARWAPSGDNTQPWRFEVIDDHRLLVHGHDTRSHCVYDLDGHPSQIAQGALLETLTIAASAHRLRAECRRHPDSPETHPVYEIDLVPDDALVTDSLQPFISQRSVQRRPMRTKPLSAEQKKGLERAVGEHYGVRWFETSGERLRMAGLMFANAKIRLTLPEAYLVHRDIIEWQAQYSEDKVPDQALGLDPMTLKLMRWVMGSWERVAFFNTWLAGHLTPRLEMDLLPGVFCAAHFAIVADKPPRTVDDYVAAGRAVQRFWLTATAQGLQLQPELTPLIFTRYVREGTKFGQTTGAAEQASRLGRRLAAILGEVPVENAAFLGRIGRGEAPRSRSLRLPLGSLLRTG
jgi:nitroreductase